MMQAKDLEFRANHSGAVAILTTPAGAERFDTVAASCPELRHRILVGDPVTGGAPRREGWLDFAELVAKGARDAIVQHPGAKAELEDAASHADEVAAKVETELTHQKRMDAAKATLHELEDKRVVARGKMAATDARFEEIERDLARYAEYCSFKLVQI
jgi:hypothetical protein